ncbi:MAG: hypothetical protein ACYSTT_23710 [Planctomycetota bacterium]
MKNTFFIFLMLFVSSMASATQQQPDILYYNNQKWSLSTAWEYPSPLEIYYYQNNVETPFTGFSTVNYRGHIAVWEVVDDKLYLNEILMEDWDSVTHEFIYESFKPSEYGVKSINSPPEESGAVFADWFSGILYCYIVHSNGVYSWTCFHVRYGEIIDIGKHLDQLDENYVTYYFRLNEDDEIDFDQQNCRLNTGCDRLSPVFGFYDNNHLNWPYNWENKVKSGAPHCKWLIKDSRLYLTGVELYSGLSYYEIDTQTLDLTSLFGDEVVDGVVDANWASGVYLIKHGYVTRESAGWPGHYFTVFNVTELTFIRIAEGQILQSYTVPKDFDTENLPQDTDPGLKQIIADYKLPTIDDLTPKVALDPSPADDAVLRRTWTNLSWTGGHTADSHDVYFGDNLADVGGGIGGTFLGNQTLTDLDVGLPGSPFPDPLVPGATYYWRINEVEAGGIKYPGEVWSFSIATQSAYNPSPPDGSEYSGMDVTLSWTAGIGDMTHDVYFGDNFDNVNAGLGDTFKGNQNSTAFDPGALFPQGLARGKTYYWRIDEVETDSGTKHKGSVWSFTIVAIQSVEYQVSASEDDGYATNDSLQNLSSDFLRAGLSSFAGSPYYMSGMVFRNVNIPQGSEIISARLKVQSHEYRLDGNVYAKIEAEAVDNAESLGGPRHIGSLPRTSSSVDWDHSEPWAADTWYESPDIAEVVQEVINRAGWSSNNSLTILYSTRSDEGGYRNFSSYDRGGDFAPKLEITYAPKFNP